MLGGRHGPDVMVPVRIDLNRAPASELMALPGIGRVRAEAIILHRVRHGWLERVEDLTRVDGIGPDTVERLLPFAVVGTVDPPVGGR